MISGQIFHSSIQDAVLAALEEAVRDQVDVLANGVVSDWGDFLMHRGMIAGLKEAIEIAREAERKFREG